MREIEFEFIFENGIKEVWLFDDIVNHDRSVNFAPIKHKRQYTGLKDKNGVKIFEGDICKTKTSAFKADDNTISLVEFVDGKFLRKIRYSGGSFGYHDLFALHCEVIGNKFEHPELLNAE